ncbi:glycosyltransferase family 1 protein [Vibrio owensii]|uniref:Glycosyltransferase n=1 Tax=Vibrio owensii TaxID=696485 RepID=A0AAP9GE61_9VIBR|nr:glycosyltransferase [Vibrio owensii]AYO15860.1 glycosyltransferase family 1 protein [Vibrio owensii]QGH48484.1 glycosyltransferase [Vibrio owensii]
MKKVLFVGNLSFSRGKLDGQTVKTRMILSSLVKKYDENHVKIIDTDDRDIFLVFRILYHMIFVNSFYYLPGVMQVKYLTIPVSIWSVLTFTNIHYIVVGGWLPQLLKKNTLLVYFMRLYKSVSVELDSMRQILADMKLNAFVLTNFRAYSTQDVNENKRVITNSPMKLVFFSRVMTEKGIFDAIAVANQLNLSLDIYGPMCFTLHSDSVKFKSMCKKNVKYKGVLDGSNIVESLKNYDVLLFPTTYEGEGYPGAIVDACFSGLLVIASDWKYNKEILEKYDVGFVMDDYVKDCCFTLGAISEEELKNYRNNAINASSHFTTSAFDEWFLRVND